MGFPLFVSSALRFTRWGEVIRTSRITAILVLGGMKMDIHEIGREFRQIRSSAGDASRTI